ncbi:outer membrane beta-barrel protein [Paraferrimonas sedimenticola]|uniref:PhoP/Q and low Mg2+ inducible outer membrane protein H1 n=1 Tax=Paraferrimonas sedimenticola TaxID=375674 RepID=A0AA37RNH7_9GAMM|nr:outer membrane beta-barrel protein [Paraferrimonas sedimenticola]GLP94718.1 PhoP/Q and low Mg2+ inducible outer membrane protein H1 [Paraferrimonas sedimenticola]
MNVKQSIIAAVAATALTAPAMAADLFIGATVGNQWTETKGAAKETSSNSNIGLRAGAILNDTHRFTGTYTRSEGVHGSKDKGESRNHNIIASYDYLVKLDDAGKVDWFIGASVGAGIFKDAGLGNEATPVYGAQTGFSYQFDNGVRTEVGYRYLKQDTKFKVEEQSFKVNSTSQLYLGVDYRF